MTELLEGAGKIAMSPKDVHDHIRRMWKESIYKTDDWRQQYLRQLKPYRGEIIAQAWDKALKEVEGPPPTPQRLVYFCKQIMGDRRPRPTREPDEDSKSHILSPEYLADVNKQIAEYEAKRGTAKYTAFDDVLLESLTRLRDRHYREVNNGR